MQCDKRNSYRRKIREEKAAAADKPTDGGAINGDISMLDASSISVANGRSRTDDEPPSKKARREAGEEDVSEGDDKFHDALEGDEDGDEIVEGEGDDEVDDDEDDEVEEDQVEDPLEDDERVGAGVRDEALDEGGEDSD